MRPMGVAVDDSGQVYVVDNGNARVQKFTNTGTYLGEFGGGVLSTPWDLVIDENLRAFVLDKDAAKVSVFEADGSLAYEFGAPGDSSGQFTSPRGIGRGGDGSIYVADSDNHRIQKFAPDGTFLTKWGAEIPGQGDGVFNSPDDVTVGPSGRVFVVDRINDRIQRFGFTALPTPDESLQVEYVMTFSERPGAISFDSSGNLFVGNFYYAGQDADPTSIWKINAITGQSEKFGPRIADPDAVLVDRLGSVWTRRCRVRRKWRSYRGAGYGRKSALAARLWGMSLQRAEG